MKRIVFCFDGTWNRLDAACPTNVVITAESVTPITADGTAQLIFYDEGVGTGDHETIRGGLFGAGLVKNLGDAYRFLIFNYSPGDELYVFGFSRGAYSARSFCGLLSTCGILLRREAARVNEVIDLYKERQDSVVYKEKLMRFRSDCSPEVCVSDDEDAWRRKNVAGYGASPASRLRVHYLGVWDTVGALGIPARYSLVGLFNKKHQFHDTRLSSFVKSARHAVAIDERRKDFQPTLWDNVDELNAAGGKASDAPDAPYQQIWFPGVHSAVGGGGERRGLSDQALEWVLDGARLAGLVLDPGPHSRIFELSPDYREYIENSERTGLVYRAMNLIAADRLPGPKKIHEVSISARRRWQDVPANLKDKAPYRPGTLAGVAEALNALTPIPDASFSRAPHDIHVVNRGDSLRAIARTVYGDANKAEVIFKANLDKLDSPDRIYPGQTLRIPRQ